MLLRLTRKHAECIDGIDLSGHRVGQIVDLPERDASLLVAEGWAVPAAGEFARARAAAGADVPGGAGTEVPAYENFSHRT